MHAWDVCHALQRLQVGKSECGCCFSQVQAVSVRALQATLVLPIEQHAWRAQSSSKQRWAHMRFPIETATLTN
jgi:hypothetical protein